MKKKKLNKYDQEIYVTDIYGIWNVNLKDVFFSSTHGTLTKIDHMLVHDVNFNKFIKD